MANILLIETATDVCSVAISVDGVVVGLQEIHPCLNHVAVITRQVEVSLAAAGLEISALDAVAVSAGPGSYTSLRVGASVAKGICYALGKPLIAVDTLEALAVGQWQELQAQHAGRPLWLLPMLDARRNEIWTAIYRSEGGQTPELFHPAQPLILEPGVFSAYLEEMASEYKTTGAVILCGNGLGKVPQDETDLIATSGVVQVQQCSAQWMQITALQHFNRQQFVDSAYFEPFYMKPPNITVSRQPVFYKK